MIPRDEAALLLQRLAAPTLKALAFAGAHTRAATNATQEGRIQASRQVLAMVDGVSHWGFFSSSLVHEYAAIDGIVQRAGCHPLSHVWLVDNQIEVHLKSDVSNIDHEQLSLGLDAGPGMPHFVALTSRRDRNGVRSASFQLMTQQGAQWRLPIDQLASMPARAVKPRTPRAKVIPLRPTVERRHDDDRLR